MVKISVIIPVYNMERYLRECLDSVLAQTLQDIEVICVDDGSTDHSYDILLEYGRKYRNVVILQQENRGAGAARNSGMEHAKGKYLCFMDPDDYYAQNKALELLYMSAEEKHALICGGNILRMSEEGKKERLGNWFSEDKMISIQEYSNIFYHIRYIFRSDVIQENNIVFPQYRRYQDPPFFLNVMVHAYEIYTISEIVYIYRKEKKNNNYALHVAIDVLNGMLDCFKMARDHNLIKLYENYLKSALYENMLIYGKYARKGQNKIWELIDGINIICREWRGESLEPFHDREGLEKYIAGLQTRRETLITRCQRAQDVVIYGAGEAGTYFLNKYGKKCGHILGFAVSRLERKGTLMEGYGVREITAYDKEALIVVAVGKKHADAVLQNLEKNQFYNVCYMDYGDMKLLDSL